MSSILFLFVTNSLFIEDPVRMPILFKVYLQFFLHNTTLYKSTEELYFIYAINNFVDSKSDIISTDATATTLWF